MPAPALESGSCTDRRSKPVAFVVLQHGSHGHASDFDNIRMKLENAWKDDACALGDVSLEFWSTPVNEGLGTDQGLVQCGSRLSIELGAALDNLRSQNQGAQILLVCIAHSFGGLLLRYALASLETKSAFADVTLVSFMTLASPHVGVRQLNPILRLGARFLGNVFSTAYKDLLLDSPALDSLCSPASLAVLRRFQHRSLYVCSGSDHLVSLETGALMVPLQGLGPLQTLARADPFPIATFVLHPIEDITEREVVDSGSQRLVGGTDASSSDAPITSRKLLQVGETGSHMEVSVSEVISRDGLVHAFSSFDDRAGRAERAAQMFLALRAVGPWILNVVTFREPLVLAHGAILQHPARVKNPGAHGTEVSSHVAAAICTNILSAIAST